MEGYHGPKTSLENLCNLNIECKTYGQQGANTLTIRKIYGAARIRYFSGRPCGEEFSMHKGTLCLTARFRKLKPYQSLSTWIVPVGLTPWLG